MTEHMHNFFGLPWWFPICFGPAGMIFYFLTLAGVYCRDCPNKRRE